MFTNIILAVISGIGLAMLWHRASIMKELRAWFIIKLHRLHTSCSFYPWLEFFVRFPRDIAGCEECTAPWLSLGMAFVLSLGWHSLLAFPCAYAVYKMVEFGRPAPDEFGG